MDLDQPGFDPKPRTQSPRSESPMFVEQESASSYSPEPHRGNRGTNVDVHDSSEIIGADHDVDVPEEDEHEDRVIQDNENQRADIDIPRDSSSPEDTDGAGHAQEDGEPEKASDDNGQDCALILPAPVAPVRNAQCGNCIALRRWVKLQASRLRSKEKLIRTKIARIRVLEAANKQHKKRIEQLERLLNNNGNRQGPFAQNNAPRPNRAQGHGARGTWQSLLRAAIRAGNPHEHWEHTWKACYKQENMPISLNRLHPNIRMVPPSNAEGPQADEPVDSDISRQGSPVTLVDRDRPRAVFRRSFDELPDKVLYKILFELLAVNGLVHFLCRLDPFVPLDSFPDAQALGPRSSGLRARLFFSYPHTPVTEFNLTNDTIAPGRFLAALAVNRKWNWYGVGIFFGYNTFALSSFGELDSFGTGMGSGRVQRIQNLEIHWVGGQCPRFDDDDDDGKAADRPRRQRHFDRRSMPLAWLAEMPRLRTLVVWLDETSNRVIRRRLEPDHIKRYMKQHTAGQPNARMTRALRVTRGWDHLHQLRGLDYIRLYNTAKPLGEDRTTSIVRDRSAVIDLNRTARMEKVPLRAMEARLTRLAPLFPPRENAWRPEKKDFTLIGQIYNQSSSFDRRETNLDIDTTPRLGTPSDGSDSDEEDEIEDSSSDEPDCDSDGSESDSGNRPRGLPSPPSSNGETRGSRGATATPSPRVGEETLVGDDEVVELAETESENTDANGMDIASDDEDGDDESSDDESSDDESSDGGDNDGHGHPLGGPEDLDDTDNDKLQMRHSRPDRFIRKFIRNHPSSGSTPQLQPGQQDGDIVKLVAEASPDRQAPIEIDTDDDEVQILPQAPPGIFATPQPGSRSRFNLVDYQRRSETSGGLFVTPGPQECIKAETEEIASATASDPASVSRASSVHVDLTLLDDTEDEVETRSTNRSQQTGPQKARRLSVTSSNGFADIDEQKPAVATRDNLQISDDNGGDDDDDNAQIPGRFLTASPQPHGIKRTRDDNDADSDPDERRRKQLMTLTFGPENN